MENRTSIFTTTDLIETSTSRKIFRLLNGTARFSQFSFMFGPTGRGKTFAARAWIEKYGNGAYLRAETGSTQTRLRRSLSRAIFGEEDARASHIRDFIAAHPGFVLVVDECNHLISNPTRAGANNLDSIRDFYDEIQDAGGRFGVCFIFTDYSLERLRKCRMASFLEQFIHRGDNHLAIPEKISRTYEVAPIVKTLIPGAGDDLIDAACRIGNVRAIFKRIAVLKSFAEKSSTTVTADMLTAAQLTFESGVWPEE